jgi:FMN-dependent NADH-azoreductase
MYLLRVDASILGTHSASAELADLVLAEWITAHPDRPIVRRHLAADPLPSNAWATAVGAGHTPEEQRTDAQRAAVALAASLTGELRAADAAVLALPLYNFGVSQHAKTWFDLAIVGGRQDERLLDGKPVVLVTTRGGAYGPGTPRAGWDHNTDYLRRILVDIWGAELTVVEREFTLVGVNPALDDFADMAAAMKATAHDDAITAGKALAAR